MDKNNRSYTNGEITVFWKPSACVHSTVCFTKLRKVFDPAKRPWVNMKGAKTKKIIDVVNQCPTDALTFKWNNETKNEKESSENKIKTVKTESSHSSAKVQIMKDGPLMIEGNFKIIGIHGAELKTANTVALCRCGHSKNMPFCDGTHRKIGFKD